LRQFSRKQTFVPAQNQRLHVQRLSPENKGISLYIPLQVGYRSKKAKFNPYMIACDFIGYFIPPVLCDLFYILIF
jgi:hypothetical protein